MLCTFKSKYLLRVSKRVRKTKLEKGKEILLDRKKLRKIKREFKQTQMILSTCIVDDSLCMVMPEIIRKSGVN